MEFVPYFIIAILIISNMVIFSILNKKRQKLDLTVAEDAKKDKTLKIIIHTLIIENAVMIFAILYFVKPLLDPSIN